MTDKQSVQALFDLLQHQVDQARNIQNIIKKLNNAKKDPELTSQRQALLKNLHSFKSESDDLQKKVNHVQEDLERTLDGDSSNSSPPKETKQETNKNGSPRDTNRLLNPEDQENAYHLKARMMPRYLSKNKALQAEILLKHRRDELRSQRTHHQINYNRETNLSAATTLHVIHMYEKKAKSEEARANALQEEVDELRAANEGKPPPKTSEENSGQSLLGRGNRVNDVIRRNEQLQSVVKDQSLEIERLRRDNNELIKKAKHAAEDRHHALNQLSTSDKAKRDLYTRYQRQKAQHDRLARSLTRQSTDWIEARKQQDQMEEEIRWRSVGHAALHGDFERTHSHPVQRNVDQPRYMYPVENYAQPVAS